MKNFKTKKIVLGTVMALSAVSLASVGFASWVINGVVGDDSNNITAIVGKIEDKTVTAAITASDLELRFDYAKTLPGEGTYTPIYTNGDKNTEKLSVSVTYEISLPANSTETNVQKVCSGVELKFKMSPNFNAAIEGQYIAVDFGDPLNNTDTDKETYNKYYAFNVAVSKEGTFNGVNTTWTVNTGDTKKISATSTFEFKWGSNFGGHNPCYRNNSDTVTVDDIKASLKTFVDTYKDSLNGQIVVTPTLVAA